MGRLPGFDYKRPFFYMATIKRAAGAALQPPFSAISPEGRIVPNAVTEAFEKEIAAFPQQWPYVEGLSPHVIMPDHIHLMVKLGRPGAPPAALGTVVAQLKKRLREAYWRVVGGAAGAALQDQGFAQADPAAMLPQIFAPDFHDWIVKKEGQLEAFRRYILENPERSARRRANRQYFTKARQIEWRGATYWAYGNEALLELPVIVAIKGHRRAAGAAGAALQDQAAGAALQDQAASAARRGSRDWLIAAAGRIGPGGAGLSTFLSPLEKDAAAAIEKAGGARIVLSMEGFPERWHPGREEERLCACGRLLFLSPYQPQAGRLSRSDMFHRAHDMVDWALAHSSFQLEAWP